MSSYLYTPSCLDPLQGVLDFVLDVKPFRTKIFQAGISIAFADKVTVKMLEDLQLEIDQDFNTHRGNCAIIPSCLVTDGFETDVFGDPNIDPAVLPRGAVSIVNGIGTITLYTSLDGVRETSTSLPETFVLRVFGDAAMTDLLATSTLVYIHDVLVSAVGPVITSVGLPITVSNTNLYEQGIPVTFTIDASAVATSVLYYDVAGTVNAYDFAYPVTPGFEPTIHYKIITDTREYGQVIGNPNFVGYTAEGYATFIVPNSCDIDNPVCPDGFETSVYEGAIYDSTNPWCEAACDCDIPEPVCIEGFDTIDFGDSLFDSYNQHCMDTCGGVFAGPCTPDMTCPSNSPTTISTQFVESLFIIDDLGQIVLTVNDPTTLDTIYSYDPTEDAIVPVTDNALTELQASYN